MTGRLRWLAAAAVAAAALGLGWSTLAGRAAADGAAVAGAPRPLPVEVLRLAPQSGYALGRSYTGVLRARRAAEVGFEVAGRVAALAVEEGRTVAAGEELGRLETDRLEARRAELRARRDAERAVLARMEAGPRAQMIEVARATVRELEERERLAVAQRERRRPLVESGAVSGEAFDESAVGAEALAARVEGARQALDELLAGTRPEDLDAQRAAVAGLDAQLASLEVELADSTLRAPFDGRVAARYVDEGAVVDTGQPAFRLVESAHLEAWIGVPVAALEELAALSRVRLTVGGRSLEAGAPRLLPEVDAGTRTATVVVSLAAADAADLRPGQVARLHLEREIAEPGFWLPTAALAESTRGLWSALVCEPESAREPESGAGPDRAPGPGAAWRARRAEVEVLHVDGERAYVRGTLAPGDRIVARGVHRLVPGQRVAPVEAGPPSGAVALERPAR